MSTKRTADEILDGLEWNEFVAYYQPQFDARTFEIVGVEALSRWQHPTQGVLTPDAYLSTAEELNVVATIDRLVLEKAIASRKEWNAAGLDVPRVSVNVSARRLQEESLVASLRAMNIQPGTVSFELVESIFLDESDELVTWNIDQIKDLGIDIEIDDFGTGYASIVSLLKLKPRRLKIDRQLVFPMVELAGAAPSCRVDHRHRQFARDRGDRRRRRDDGACAPAQGARLRCAAGLCLRRSDERRRVQDFRPRPAEAGRLVICAQQNLGVALQPFGL